MLRTLSCILAVCQLFAASFGDPSIRAVFGAKSGVLLRMHVIAQDDTDAMQSVKLAVRDAVRAAYAKHSPEGNSNMLEQARILLPRLTQAAEDAARLSGFTGSVSASIEYHAFDERTLDGLTFPAGEYPSLMIRLGDAQGKNWWGLLDPRLALSAASLSEGETVWDWSLDAVLQFLRQLGTQAGDTDA